MIDTRLAELTTLELRLQSAPLNLHLRRERVRLRAETAPLVTSLDRLRRGWVWVGRT